MSDRAGSAPRDESLGDLLADLTREMGRLIRGELTLARRELGQKAAEAGRDAAAVGAGAAVGYAGLLTLLAAAVLRLGGAPKRARRSALVVGMVASAVGGFLALWGLAGLRRRDWVPRQTLGSLQEDAETLTGGGV